MTKHKGISVDQKSYDLAEHFLQDEKNVSKERTMLLAQAIQKTVEDFLEWGE